MTSPPTGLCECGCGQKTTVPRFDNNRYGHKADVPLRFVHGHNTRRTPHDYTVDDVTGCWVWQRSVLKRWGYGMAWRGGKHVLAHRWFYEDAKGPIPEGMHLDHLCRNRRCVNPAHLEVVTRRQNMQRSANAKLTRPLVTEIRKRYATSGDPMKTWARANAARYNVSEHCLYDVISRRTWQDDTVQT